MQIVEEGQCLGIAEVAGGQAGFVQLLAAEDFSYALRPEESPELVLQGPGFVYAPAVEGADAGYAYILIEGRAVGKVPVTFGATVERKTEETKSYRKQFFG